MLRISRGPRNVPSESTTPRGSPSVCGGSPAFFGGGPIFSGNAPCPATWTMRQSRPSRALTMVWASAPSCSGSSGLISALHPIGAKRRRQPLRDRHGLVARPRQARIDLWIASRLADDQHAGVRRSRRPPAPESRPYEACVAVWCESPRAADRSRSPGVSLSSISHGMPAVPPSTSSCTSVVPPRNGSISSGINSSNSVRPMRGIARPVLREHLPRAFAPADFASPVRGPRCVLAWYRGCRRFGLHRLFPPALPPRSSRSPRRDTRSRAGGAAPRAR